MRLRFWGCVATAWRGLARLGVGALGRAVWPMCGWGLGVWLAAGAAPAAPAGSIIATDKESRPTAAGPRPPLTPLDCSAAPVIVLHAGSDTALVGSTVGLPNQTSGYNCVMWNETGGEAIYRLQATEELLVIVALRDLTSDLDVFVLSSCDSGDCIGGASQEVAVSLLPGTHFLVIDGSEGAAGTFTASLRARALGVPASLCDGPDAAERVLCTDGAQTLEGDILGQPDLIAAYDCSPYVESGGEVWYALVVPDTTRFTATLSGQTFDGALWVFDGCGPTATCLAFSDRLTAGGQESVTFRNESGAQAVFLIGVDAFRPPSVDGMFTLQISCANPAVLPAQRSSWGAIKTRYR